MAGAKPVRWWGDPAGELRWPLELARLLADPVFRGRGIPVGDGSPVLVLPGFAAGDGSARVLRAWLRRIGYVPYGSRIVLNVDCSDRLVKRLEGRLAAIARRHGRPVALVGHSRGGLLARALAAQRPQDVAAVVTLGSALSDQFAISVPLELAVGGVRLYHRLVTDRAARRGCLTHACSCDYTRALRAPLAVDVPLTSVRAADDGVVRRRACVAPGAHNVEVAGSHVGLAVNAAAYRAIAGALAAAQAS